jgi:hypothetical protein
MPQLAAHQLRVAAVAYAITQAIFEPLHDEELISACLLHDMGNILKFDFAVFPESVEPQGLEYWEGVKEEWRKKYGPSEHVATLTIAREIGVSERTISYIDAVGFSTAEENEKSDSFEKKVAAYADMRVDPHGVVTLAERLEDLDRRYGSRTKNLGDEASVALFAAALHAIEQQIFTRASDTPESITALSCEKYIPMLKKYHVV